MGDEAVAVNVGVEAVAVTGIPVGDAGGLR